MPVNDYYPVFQSSLLILRYKNKINRGQKDQNSAPAIFIVQRRIPRHRSGTDQAPEMAHAVGRGTHALKSIRPDTLAGAGPGLHVSRRG